MKGLVGKSIFAGIFIVFTSIALAIGVDASEIQYGTELKKITNSIELSFLASESSDTGTLVLLSLGLIGLVFARRRGA